MRYYVIMNGPHILGLGQAQEGEGSKKFIEEHKEFQVWELPKVVFDYMGVIMDMYVEEGSMRVEERVKVVPVIKARKPKSNIIG